VRWPDVAGVLEARTLYLRGPILARIAGRVGAAVKDRTPSHAWVVAGFFTVAPTGSWSWLRVQEPSGAAVERSAARISIVENGVETDLFRPITSHESEPLKLADRFLIVTSGRWEMRTTSDADRGRRRLQTHCRMHVPVDWRGREKNGS